MIQKPPKSRPLKYGWSRPGQLFVLEDNGEILGTYYIRPINQAEVLTFVIVVTWCPD
jgi:hypothetical protein